MYDQLPKNIQMRLDEKTLQAKVGPIWKQIQAGIDEGTATPPGVAGLVQRFLSGRVWGWGDGDDG